jgi:hypothetical protein
MSTEPDRDQESTAMIGCRSCGSPSAQAWDTSDGRVLLCQPCAVLHDVGCP